MKILKTATLSVVTLVCMQSCKKDNPLHEQSMSNGTTTQFQSAKKKVNQASYDLNERQTMDLINNFKQRTQSMGAKANAEDPQNITLEAAVFEIEAALNYDYDFNPDQEYGSYLRTSVITAPLGTGETINVNDLEVVYQSYKDSVDVFTNDSTKVKLINVEAEIDFDANVVNFVMKTTAYNILAKSTCAPFTSGVATPSRNKWCFNVCCVPPPLNYMDAPAVLTQKLNCLLYIGCTWGVFYTGIITPNDISALPGTTSAYPSMLYSTGYKANYVAPAPTCANPYFCGTYDLINATTLNGYKSLMSNYIAQWNPPNWIPPAGKVMAHAGVLDNLDDTTIPGSRSVFWTLSLQYGKKNCRTAPPQ